MVARRLPIGYRFKPSKKQLLGYFLTNKLSGQPLPSSCLVLEYDIYSDHPLNILAKINGGVQEDEKGCVEGYFFTRLKKTNRNAKKVGRYIKGHGTWSGKSKIKNVNDEAMTVVGYERYFKFAPVDNRKNEPENEKEWKMHEYSLSLENNEFVLCHITNKVDSSKVGDKSSRALKRNRNEYSFMGSNYEIGSSSKSGREEYNKSPQECSSVSINNPSQHDDVHQVMDYGLQKQQYYMHDHGLHQQYTMSHQGLQDQQYIMNGHGLHQQYTSTHDYGVQNQYTMPNHGFQDQQYLMPHVYQDHLQHVMRNEVHQQDNMPHGHCLQEQQYTRLYDSDHGYVDTNNEACVDGSEPLVVQGGTYCNYEQGAPSLNYSLSECVNDNIEVPQEDAQTHEIQHEQAFSLSVSGTEHGHAEISEEAFVAELEGMLSDNEEDETHKHASTDPHDIDFSTWLPALVAS